MDISHLKLNPQYSADRFYLTDLGENDIEPSLLIAFNRETRTHEIVVADPAHRIRVVDDPRFRLFTNSKSADRDGILYEEARAGSFELRSPVLTSGELGHYSWSADGRMTSYYRLDDSGVGAYVYTCGAGTKRVAELISAFYACHGGFSPDSSFIAFDSAGERSGRIFDQISIVDAQGGGWAGEEPGPARVHLPAEDEEHESRRTGSTGLARADAPEPRVEPGWHEDRLQFGHAGRRGLPRRLRGGGAPSGYPGIREPDRRPTQLGAAATCSRTGGISRLSEKRFRHLDEPGRSHAGNGAGSGPGPGQRRDRRFRRRVLGPGKSPCRVVT
jgi:hypothetical protein